MRGKLQFLRKDMKLIEMTGRGAENPGVHSIQTEMTETEAEAEGPAGMIQVMMLEEADLTGVTQGVIPAQDIQRGSQRGLHTSRGRIVKMTEEAAEDRTDRTGVTQDRMLEEAVLTRVTQGMIPAQDIQRGSQRGLHTSRGRLVKMTEEAAEDRTDRTGVTQGRMREEAVRTRVTQGRMREEAALTVVIPGVIPAQDIQRGSQRGLHTSRGRRVKKDAGQTGMRTAMNSNDILRRIRYALNIHDKEMAEIFKLAGYDIPESKIADIMKKEEEDGYIECSGIELTYFLDGLIIKKRGKREVSGSEPAVKTDIDFSNNGVLKKLRIALNFKEADMIEMLKRSDFEITKPELSALFRAKDSSKYKACGDQILKNFLNGLTAFYRKK
jgi:uncharacterized protein YehS (DUF1456 family)